MINIQDFANLIFSGTHCGSTSGSGSTPKFIHF